MSSSRALLYTLEIGSETLQVVKLPDLHINLLLCKGLAVRVLCHVKFENLDHFFVCLVILLESFSSFRISACLDFSIFFLDQLMKICERGIVVSKM